MDSRVEFLKRMMRKIRYHLIHYFITRYGYAKHQFLLSACYGLDITDTTVNYVWIILFTGTSRIEGYTASKQASAI